MKTMYTGSPAKKITIALFTAAAFAWLPTQASASFTGITGMSVSGCTCHGNGLPSAATSLVLSSSTGKFEVEPGGTLTLTLQISHASQSAGGLNVSIVNSEMTKSGTITPGNAVEMRVTSRELTHKVPKQFVDGQTTFTFTWTAPTTPGTYTVYAAGNAVNQNGQTSGDFFNTITQQIAVGPTTAVGEEPVAGATLLHSIDIAPSPVRAGEGTAEIRYQLARSANVTIELFDMQGRPVQPMENTAGDAGEHIALIDTRRLAGGMYIAVLRAGNEQIARHFTVVR